jgi:hypothetical protein
MMDKLDQIIEKIKEELTAIGINVEPQDSSPIDWETFPVIYVEVIGNAPAGTELVGYYNNDAELSLICFVQDEQRTPRRQELTGLDAQLRAFISTNYQWGCLAAETFWDSSDMIVTTDQDHLGALTFNFTVNYREKRPCP